MIALHAQFSIPLSMLTDMVAGVTLGTVMIGAGTIETSSGK